MANAPSRSRTFTQTTRKLPPCRVTLLVDVNFTVGIDAILKAGDHRARADVEGLGSFVEKLVVRGHAAGHGWESRSWHGVG